MTYLLALDQGTSSSRSIVFDERGHIVAQAQHGPGWVEYDITNPSTGGVQTKMSFVSQVDAGYVGCGVYKTLAAR